MLGIQTPRPQDGRHRQNHRAMAAPRPSRVAVRFLCKVKAPSSIKKICLNILDQQLQLRPDRESETFFDFFWLMKSHWTQVWPDWAIFERSCWENCVQSSPNTLPFKEKKLWPLEDKLGHFLIKNLVTLLNKPNFMTNRL